jgi:hypothetical protein
MCTASVASLVAIALVFYDERHGGVLAARSTGKSAKQEWDERQAIAINVQEAVDK